MKKVFSIISVIAVAAVLTLNISLSKNSKTGNVNLASISATTEASAECIITLNGQNMGKCSRIYNVCFFSPDCQECDPTIGF